VTSRHVAVLILYDGQGRILLQHRTCDAPSFPGHWGLFGGGIEPGETPEQAVKREILEELSYQLRSVRRITGRQFVHGGVEYTTHVFVERYDGSPLLLGEGQGMKWLSLEQMADIEMIDHDREVVLAAAVDIFT
jgi:8-oxo-dGTP diphosphatase